MINGISGIVLLILVFGSAMGMKAGRYRHVVLGRLKAWHSTS
jgi:hypothetical protein